MNRNGYRASALALVVGMMLSPAAEASQILTAVQSKHMLGGGNETKVTDVAGTLLSTILGSSDTRAVTDYGVNKIYASGSATYKQYATSSWLDTYTVGGTAGTTAHVAFTFSIDGSAAFDEATGAGFNFNVYALRGGGWSMSGYGGNGNWYQPMTSGTNYERLILTQTIAPIAGTLPAGRITQADMRDFEGFSNFANNGGQPGSFGSHVFYQEQGDYFQVDSRPVVNTPGGPMTLNASSQFFANGYKSFNYGATPPANLTSYSVNPSALAQRNNLLANYSLLDMAQLCPGDECEPGAFDTTLTLEFDLAVGSVFTLATFMNADDVLTGTVDLFHTAKMSGVTVSGGGTLTSGSGTLNALPGGGYGYAAVQALDAAAVPEPATWAMMIGGFGFVGVALRRRRRGFALAA